MSAHHRPRITPDTFLHTVSLPNRTGPIQPSPPITIFLISGNPGLISYYHTFLSLLSEKLNQKLKSHTTSQVHPPSFQIYGHSLGGFALQTPQHPHPCDYDLEDQIGYVQGKLDEFLSSPEGCGSSAAEGKSKVILIGHSVGSYIAMEILRRHRERAASAAAATAPHGSTASFDIIGGIMLFPTVMDIAKSPSGRKLTRLLCVVPQLALVVGFLARVLVALLPASWLRGLIRVVMGSAMPENAVETTAAFVQSKTGVRQALHMAADEMRTITADKWSDDVWGVSTADEPLARLVFYFGRNDHWVAERTRDEIIELRGRVEGGPTMLVCEDGLPHAFCLRHNEVMAGKVADMVMDIVSE
ncbi:bifunctional triacylglycerol lipase/ester hydrolase [Aspergillus clavatus NRRL 1]|uniref:Lipid droplet-associated hydrolase n=1 Tax=Aspergillus clavatus (strain ATCC 1007 / CBS 513.65 / DSM 816 / NCTC 3887 / NRRL 1 / QM 1276 / 107) TaxID=344612 RepID=A1CAS0_ASPCL|nr:uncharacterized protein ACLA_012660 [Aspergillus clavatus NRRL 1]EAW12838.1 conserved hypothetical protein [Aspergillus clavatus NRRL 1]